MTWWRLAKSLYTRATANKLPIVTPASPRIQSAMAIQPPTQNSDRAPGQGWGDFDVR